MKRYNTLLLALLFTLGASSLVAQRTTHELLQHYLQSDTTLSASPQNIISFIGHLERKERAFKSESEFLRYLFHKTHQKFLKHYETYSSFGELVSTGQYNCLTGTALYALLLDHFSIEHTSIETNYHIFILAKSEGKSILIEATDPLGGFVTNEKEIASKLESYRKQGIQASATTNQVRYEFSFNLWEPVSLQELTGLLFFNQSIKAYNEQQLEASVYFLMKASCFRPSERVEEFSSLLLATVAESTLSTARKQQLNEQLSIVQKQSTHYMSASIGE